MCFVGVEKLSLVDFDGYLSIVLFTSQCNMRCLYCQNTKLILNENKIIPWKKIKDFLIKNTKKIDAVVITGGEPLIQKKLIERIKEIKKMGFLIKLDTNGLKSEKLKNILENKLVDYVAMDIKNDFKNYNYITGINGKNIVENIKKSILYLKKSKIKFEFRTTIIKEFHNLKNLLEIAKVIKPCEKYVLQHYKYQKECLFRFNEINKDTALKYLKNIKKIIPNTYLRGY